MDPLLKWFEDNGVTWDKDFVQVQPTSNNSDQTCMTHACYAVKDCQKGQVSK